MRTFVFLDIDGVLNNQNTIERSPDKFIGIDHGNLSVLKKLLSLIGDPSIILSSSWKVCWKNHGRPNKEGRYVIDNLRSIGYEIDGFTCDFPYDPFYHVGWTRGDGIKRYLKDNPHKNYIIFDDEPFDFYHAGVSKHFVQTDYKTGLQDSDIKTALDILRTENVDFYID